MGAVYSGVAHPGIMPNLVSLKENFALGPEYEQHTTI